MPDQAARAQGAGLPLPGGDPPRAKSLLVTLFGDVIAVHGGTAGLAGLIRFCAGFGASERNVRTAVHRLAKEGWVTGERAGRASHYRLSEDGRERFAAASERIYAPGRRAFSNRWQIILAPALTAAQRTVLQREMRWLGYVNIGGRTLLHVGNGRAETARVLREIGLRDRVCVFDASCDDLDRPGQAGLLRQMAAGGWDLPAIEERYRKFLGRFAPLHRRVRGGTALPPGEALRARVLLIHEFRRALLPDPDLPSMLLPDRWSGHEARKLCADLYRTIAPAGEPAARSAFNAPGLDALPPADGRFWERFGGLGESGPASSRVPPQKRTARRSA